MNNYLLFIALLLVSALGLTAQEATLTEQVKAHVEYLASDQMAGRAAGSSGARAASQYIFEQFQAMGYQPVMQDLPVGNYRNVMAVIPGETNEYILLGAHLDGVGKMFGLVFNAADDNASGVAALLESARLLKDTRGRYGLLFVAFDAEEIGLIGSKYFLDNFKGGKIALMMSIDMVGHLSDEARLTYEGAATIDEGTEVIKSVSVEGLSVRCLPVSPNNGVMTDSFYYAQAGIPSLTVTSDLASSAYHQADDDAESLDMAGIGLVARHIAGLTQVLQGGIKPSGTNLYMLDRSAFGFQAGYAALALGTNRETLNNLHAGITLNLAAWIPLGYIGSLGLGLKPSVGYAALNYEYRANEYRLHAVEASIQLYSPFKIRGIGLAAGIGAYYHFGFASQAMASVPEFTLLVNPHEFGLHFAIEGYLYDIINVLNGWGMGIEWKTALNELSLMPDTSGLRSQCLGMYLTKRF